MMGYTPPTSTSRPPDVIHVIGVPRPSPFFALFCFRVLWKPKNKKRGRPSNEANINACLSLLSATELHHADRQLSVRKMYDLWKKLYLRFHAVPYARFVDSVYLAQHSSYDASKKFEITDQGVTLTQKEKADRSYFCSASVETENSVHPP